jgi:predicted  nucleic acid-binding Zn-ribbon protein
MAEPTTLEERVERLEGKVAALTVERETHTQELDYLRERNKALEAAMAASAALIQAAIDPSSSFEVQEAQQPS